MLRIKVGKITYIGHEQGDHPFLPRQHGGWDPTMTEQQVYDAARGWWRLSRRAEQERYAIVVAQGVCRMAIEINEWRQQGNRRAFAGRILQPGNPVHDRFVGEPDPAKSTSRNPVHYLTDPVDQAICRCGCGETIERGEWVMGHDQRAIHQRIRTDFDGSVSRFIDWYDANGPSASEN